MIEWKCDVCHKRQSKHMGEFRLTLEPLDDRQSQSTPTFVKDYHLCSAHCRDFFVKELEQFNPSMDRAV